MEFWIFGKGACFNRRLCLVLIIILSIIPLLHEVTAEHKEFEVKNFEEKFSIPHNDIRTIDFTFQKGKILEIIYTVQAEEELPIDVWFVNEDNYLLLSGGAQFLYFIDGTGQQVSYAKKVVTLTKHDNYQLVMTNYYNNQTVEVNIIGEARIFKDGSEETTSEFPSYLVYILIIIVIILVIAIIGLGFKIRKYKRVVYNELDMGSRKKEKKDKSKKGKDKDKGFVKKAKDKKAKRANGPPADFCGHCGTPADTPYCKNCGRKV